MPAPAPRAAARDRLAPWLPVPGATGRPAFPAAPPPPARPASLDDAGRALVTRCLNEVMGPIAPLLVRRAEIPGMDAEDLAAGCAGFVRHASERTRFLALVSHAKVSQ